MSYRVDLLERVYDVVNPDEIEEFLSKHHDYALYSVLFSAPYELRKYLDGIYVFGIELAYVKELDDEDNNLFWNGLRVMIYVPKSKYTETFQRVAEWWVTLPESVKNVLDFGIVESDETTTITKIALDIVRMLEKKNKDYGDSYAILREEYGPISFVIRLSDKINRLKTLVNKPQADSDESLEDTIRDIIGYCLLELEYRGRKNARK